MAAGVVEGVPLLANTGTRRAHVSVSLAMDCADLFLIFRSPLCSHGEKLDRVEDSCFGITLVCLLIRLFLLADEHIRLRMFRPQFFAAVTLVFVVLYLGLRIRHIRTLYASARNLEREECNGLFCAGQKIVPLRSVLLITQDGILNELLHKPDCFVQSKALMHVKLSTAHGLLPLDGWKVKMQLFKSQLEKEEEIQFASQAYFSPHVSHRDPHKFDLVIEYFDRDGQQGYEPAGLEKKLNGVI